MTLTPEHQTHLRELLQDLCNLEEGLTRWEVDFVEKMSKANLAFLTEKQVAKIEELAERKL